VDAPLAPLPKSLGTAIDFTLKWFLSGVSKVMFHQVLLQGKVLIAFVTHPLLVYLVDLHMPLKTILCFEDLCATEDVTSEPFITLLIILGHF
jgi:hypothetical protein